MNRINPSLKIKFLSPTDTKGARWSVSNRGRDRKTYAHNYEIDTVGGLFEIIKEYEEDAVLSLGKYCLTEIKDGYLVIWGLE